MLSPPARRRRSTTRSGEPTNGMRRCSTRCRRQWRRLPSCTETPSFSRCSQTMLNKMQAAVEEIAQLYGNPVFLQVFTNDAERASELKQRLKAARSWDDIRRELAGLEKKRDELLNDIALKEREAARLTGRLVRQRSALDALATAVEAARKAVEETAK